MAMTEREKIIAIMSGLNLPKGRYVLGGSAVMILHGIEREDPLGDLDIFLATRDWHERLANPYWSGRVTFPEGTERQFDPPYFHSVMHGIPVHIFHSWRTRSGEGESNFDPNAALKHADEIDGITTVNLHDLIAIKLVADREKDRADVKAIRDHLWSLI